MKRLIIYFILSAIPFLGLAAHRPAPANYMKQFELLSSAKDMPDVSLIKFLKKWEAAEGNNADVDKAWFRFYVKKFWACHSLKDSDDAELLQKCLYYADKGIEKNPARLDIRLAKISLLGEIADWKNYTAEVIAMIDYSSKFTGTKNNWRWAENKKVDNSVQFMLNQVQGYQFRIYHANDNDLLTYMKQIAEAVLTYYPENVESLTDLSIVYMIRRDFDHALESLLKAEKSAPENCLVLKDIAQSYLRKGDIENSIVYYEKVQKYGDESTKESATQNLAALKGE